MEPKTPLELQKAISAIVTKELPNILRNGINLVRVGTITAISEGSHQATVVLKGTGDTLNNVKYSKDITDINVGDECIIIYPDQSIKTRALIIGIYGGKSALSDNAELSQRNWQTISETWTYASADTPTFTFTVPGDFTNDLTLGGRIKLTQTQAFTNDPAAGSNITLNMTDTTGFVVGNVVTVSSSAGSEEATIGSIVANTSITLNTLTLNHTTTDRLVSFTKYFIITKLAFASDTTTVTIYGGTDYKLANSTILSPMYSTLKAPIGFPLDASKWTVSYTASVDFSQASPVQNTWYNAYSTDIPIGSWNVHYSGVIAAVSNAAQTGIRVSGTLSTTNNSETDTELSIYGGLSGASGTLVVISGAGRYKCISLTSKTTYYFNMRTISTNVASITTAKDHMPLVIKSVCAYL